MIERFRALAADWQPHLARARPWLRGAWIVAILAYVAFSLREIGIARVWSELPRAPAFYLVYWAGFMILPISERLIFARIWSDTPPVPIPVLLRKRVLNQVVFGYSGDIWFFWWASRHLGVPERQVLAGVKDSTLLSGVAAAAVTLILVGWFSLVGSGWILVRAMGDYRAFFIALGLVILFIAPVALRFRRQIFWVGGGTALFVLAAHFLRIAMVQGVEVAIWSIVLPQVPFATWLLFLTVQMLINQLPIVPNRDLLFLAVGIELTARVGVDQAALAALFVAVTLLKQITNLTVFVLTSFLRNDHLSTKAEPAGSSANP